VRIAGVKVGDHTPPSLPGHVANFKRGWSVSENEGWRERLANDAGKVIYMEGSIIYDDIRSAIDEVDVMRECRNTALKLVSDVTAERDRLKAENADLKKRVERYEAALKAISNHQSWVSGGFPKFSTTKNIADEALKDQHSGGG